MADALLEVRGLQLGFAGGGGTVAALSGVDLCVGRGEIVGLMGGSGAGKTTLARAILRLIDVDAGAIVFEGRDIVRLRGEVLRRLRPRLQMVFQDQLAAFNPRAKVERVIGDPLALWSDASGRGGRRTVMELLDAVGLPASLMTRFPHELSGGQRQRVAIARALATNPALIVLDEPVSALDVSVRAQVLNLLLDLRERMGIAYLFIAHDLPMMAAFCDRLCLMEAGRIVESGTPEGLVTQPKTRAMREMIAAVPKFER